MEPKLIPRPEKSIKNATAKWIPSIHAKNLQIDVHLEGPTCNPYTQAQSKHTFSFWHLDNIIIQKVTKMSSKNLPKSSKNHPQICHKTCLEKEQKKTPQQLRFFTETCEKVLQN